MESDDQSEEWSPHLVFLVPGLNGCSQHFDYLTESLLSVWGEEIVVHACTANDDSVFDIFTLTKSFLTTDGIEAGGKRIAEEVVKCVQAWEGDPPLSINFWGHSMGGLYARYAIAELLDERGSGTICGLPPRLFITTACPHIGVAGTFASPVVTAGSAIGVLGSRSSWLGRSGQQLFWEDEDLFLWRLACEDRYVEALNTFKFRVLVANICNDAVVDFCVSALQPRRPSWLFDEDVCPALSEMYPHVVYDSQDFNHQLDSLNLDVPSTILDQLDQLSVRRRTSESSSALREHSKFQRGGSILKRRESVESGSAPSSLLSWLWGSRDVTSAEELVPDPSPTIYCSGHPHELEMEAARLCLAALPWRLICMRFDDYPGQNAHDAVICKQPLINANDGVEYITQIVLQPVFGTVAPAKDISRLKKEKNICKNHKKTAREKGRHKPGATGHDQQSCSYQSSSGSSLHEELDADGIYSGSQSEDDEKIWL